MCSIHCWMSVSAYGSQRVVSKCWIDNLTYSRTVNLRNGGNFFFKTHKYRQCTKFPALEYFHIYVILFLDFFFFFISVRQYHLYDYLKNLSDKVFKLTFTTDSFIVLCSIRIYMNWLDFNTFG